MKKKNQVMLKILINHGGESLASYSSVGWVMDLYLDIMGYLNPVSVKNWGRLSYMYSI